MNPGNALPATIKTERLTLRSPQPGDLSRLVALLNNWKVVEPTAVIPFPYSEDDGREFLDTLGDPDKPRNYALAAEDNSLLGVIGIKFIENKPPEIGYWVGEPYWGQGYAVEASLALLAAVRELQTITEVRARVLAHNRGSIRVLEKSGFTLVERTNSIVERHLGKPVLIMRWSAR
jgi:RimJ/RimL family protein N-acetyltransferase